MQSLKEFYKQGNGPSSSHTMGPKKAAEMFKKEYKDADFFEVILYGSLAATGKGHLTDYIIEQTLKPIKVNIIFDKNINCYNLKDIIERKNRVFNKNLWQNKNRF